MKKVLVTGASGFIGKPSIIALQKRGFQVYALSTRKINKTDTATIWCQADLHNHQSTKDLLAEIKPSHLLHLAWYVEHGKYWSSAENLKWVSSSLNLIDQFTTFGGRRIVCAGTCAEYDWGQETCSKSLSETLAPINPHTLYGASKAGLQTILNAWAQTKEVNYAWGRLFFPYGPNENSKRLIPSTILSLLRGEAMTFHNPQLQRDLTFVDDNGEIFAALLDSEIFGSVNIAGGNAIKLGQIIDLIAKSLKAENLIEYKPTAQKISEPLTLYANIDRLKNELGVLARTTLEEGVEKTINWWSEQIKSNHLAMKSE